MDFIANYWVILLVAFILVMLLLLSYLIDREIRKMKDDDDTDNGIDEVENNNIDVDLDDSNVVKTSYEDLKDLNEDSDDLEEILDYDELDIENIDDDFNKVISKKKLIDTSIKDSVEAMEVSGVDIKEEESEKDIELPDIKIKKETNADIWE